MVRILVAVLIFFPSTIFAQGMKCPKGFQPYDNGCVTQRMFDYLACVERSGGNHQEIIQEMSEIAGQETSGGIEASGQIPTGRAKGRMAFNLTDEKTLLKRLETKWFPNGMSECRKVLDKKEMQNYKRELERSRKASQKSSNLIQQTSEKMEKNQANHLNAIDAFNNNEIKNLTIALAVIYKREVGASDADAKQWAQDTLEKAGAFKKDRDKEDELRNELKTKSSKSIIVKVYKLFDYVIVTTDSRFIAFQTLKQKVKYETSEKYLLFNDDSTSEPPYIFRTVVLPNRNKILLTIHPGKLKQGIVTTCPSLEFSEFNEQNKLQSFKIRPLYADSGPEHRLGGGMVEFEKQRALNDVRYIVKRTGDDMLNQQFKDQFDLTFREFFQIAIAR